MQPSFRPPLPRPATLDGPAGPLEARVEDPCARGGPGRRAASYAIRTRCTAGRCRTRSCTRWRARCRKLGAPTVRFNFRGVGRSAGHYDAGAGEREDALAACAWARAHWRCETLWLAGFSFGAAVALEAAVVAKPAALVTVAPPVGRIIVAPITRPSCPWLVVQGDRDELVDVATVRRWVGEFAVPPQLRRAAGGGALLPRAARRPACRRA